MGASIDLTLVNSLCSLLWLKSLFYYSSTQRSSPLNQVNNKNNKDLIVLAYIQFSSFLAMEGLRLRPDLIRAALVTGGAPRKVTGTISGSISTRCSPLRFSVGQKTWPWSTIPWLTPQVMHQGLRLEFQALVTPPSLWNGLTRVWGASPCTSRRLWRKSFHRFNIFRQSFNQMRHNSGLCKGKKSSRSALRLSQSS